ncbi:MAG: hypothetical protein UMU75_12885, partial [Halomonas sp.]|nr:hypothetical protein [Halomonas sp.]
MSIILIPSLRPLALAGLAVIGLTAASVAMSDETGALPELNYDEAGQRLLKVERHTLSQSTDQGR